jgi:hypothetical protein
MKKILILTILLIPIWSMDQEQFDDTTTANGKPTLTVTQSQPLPVRIYDVTGFTILCVDSLIAKTDTVSYTWSDTVSELNAIRIATLVSKFPQFYSGYLWSDSTLEVSSTYNFASGKSFKTVAGVPCFLGYWNTASKTNWYFRRGNTVSGRKRG